MNRNRPDLRHPAVALLALAAAVAAAGAGSTGGETILYRVASVKGKLVRELAEGKERLQAGAPLRSGDVLRTGWWSEAVIEAPEAAASFTLGPRTRVRLASEVPGALLEVERGRLHALFGRLRGGDGPGRLVTTPTAILAVRGTEYGIRVDRAGGTTLAVFEGVVRVQDRLRRFEPVEVGAGLGTVIRRGEAPAPPRPHGLTRESWERGGPAGRSGEPGGPDGPGEPGAGGPPRGGGGSGRHGG